MWKFNFLLFFSSFLTKSVVADLIDRKIMKGLNEFISPDNDDYPFVNMADYKKRQQKLRKKVFKFRFS